MLYLLDTSVILAAMTATHPQQSASRALVEILMEPPWPIQITAESLVELLHIAAWQGDRQTGAHLIDRLLVLFPQPITLSPAILRRAAALTQRQGRLNLRAALQAACAESIDCQDIISFDEDLGLVAGLRRWEPDQVLAGHRSKAR